MSNSLEQNLIDHLTTNDLDIRKTGNARFIDQKCTPDVLCAVAEAILEYVENNEAEPFTIRNIWESPIANEIMTELFQKPAVNEPNAANEYDKVFSQPIKLLEYAKILTSQKSSGPANGYKINDKKLLTYISQKDKNSLKFIRTYLEKVLLDSGLWPKFSLFFNNPNRTNFDSLKKSFVDFIIEYTDINKATEPKRIFTKILNPLAFQKNTFGTKQGRLSTQPIQYAELFYNRENFRDIRKPKNITRKEFQYGYEVNSTSEKYQTTKAIKLIKKRHGEYSEVHRFKTVTSIQVHHIFMKNEFPELSDKFENLITLTPTQHNSFAHPDNNTNCISLPYQLVCLLAKLDSVEQSIKDGDEFYTLENFKAVVNTGIGKRLLTDGMSPEEIKQTLSLKYTA